MRPEWVEQRDQLACTATSAGGAIAGRLPRPTAAGVRPPGQPVGWYQSASFIAAARANLANAGNDRVPVFVMIEARWFSTVR
jgi:hypothetical protein